jgi:tetratricopeptide (TPR) repeat protein
MRRCRDDALEHGDVAFALYAENLRGYMLWVVGEPLADLERARRQFMELGRSLGYADWRDSEHLLAVFAALTTGAADGHEASSSSLTASPLLMPVRCAWMACHCILGEHQRAFDASESLLADIDRLYCTMPHVQEFWLFRGLSAASLASEARGRARRRYRRVLERSRRRMRHWARHGPENFEASALLLDAEKARLSGRTQRALLLYTRSAEHARSQSYLQHEALAQERRGRLLVAMRRETEAEKVLRQAARIYQAWGAHAAAARLVRTPTNAA